MGGGGGGGFFYLGNFKIARGVGGGAKLRELGILDSL